MNTYYLWTIGCQMNKAESERLASYLERLGYQPVSSAEEADLIFLNTCVVRQSAENRVINKLLSLEILKKIHPQVNIVLTGCFIVSDIDKLKQSFPFVDYFLHAGSLPDWLGEHKPQQILPMRSNVACYVPIIQGCNNFCSYCIVPFRRGRERSRPIEEIVSEVKDLVSSGVKEVTLLGQNVDSYGNDLPDTPDLADLLYNLNPLEGLFRIRFLTNHPKDMKFRLIDAIAKLDKVCEQINLPVQSGDNQILKAMHRGYTVEQYRELITKIRTIIPGVALSTDIIVGFPGESEEQFQNTCNLLSQIRFDMVHVAAYSPRPGTLAARNMEDNVPPGLKKERLDQIERLQSRINGEINAQLKDKVVEVLVEGKSKGKWTGRTRGDKPVFFTGGSYFKYQLVNIRVNHTTPWSINGNIAETRQSCTSII